MNEIVNTDNPLSRITAIDGLSGKLRKALTAYVFAETIYRSGKAYLDRKVAEARYTVAVGGEDNIYGDVHEWILDQLPPEKRRALIARSSKSTRHDTYVVEPERQEDPTLHLFFDGTREQTLVFDGHSVKVQIERPEGASGSPGDSDKPSFKLFQERIIFSCRSIAARDAVLSFLDGITKKQLVKPPRFFTASKWGDWRQKSAIGERSLDTVILRKGQKEALVQDLRHFLSLEEEYARFGLPWHRGYLLHGVPGCGKTSIARAIASDLHLDTYYLSLGSIENDSALVSLFGDIEPRSILLLEDLDIVHGASSRTDKDGGVSLQGLLNALDGFVTPFGLITFMTTNHLEILDPALIRPGRVDWIEEIGVVDDAQLAEIVELYTGKTPCLPPLTVGRTPAEIIDVLKCTIGTDVDPIPLIKGLL